MYYGCKVFLAGAVSFLALSLALPSESRAAIAKSTEVRQDTYCYKINGAGMKIYVDRNAAGAICEPPPQLDGIWPDAGPLSGGEWFYVWGLHFKEGAEVLFNGTPCIPPIEYYLDSQYGWGNDYIVCSTPAGKAAGSVDVVVQNPSGVKSNAVTYTYFEPQVVISISPTSGSSSGGTLVTVTGKGFGDWTYYPYFYGSGAYATCNNMTLIDSEHFTCTTSQVYGSACGGDTKMDFYVYDTRSWSQNVLYGAFTFVSPKLFAGSGTAADPFLVGTRDDLFNVRYCPTMTFGQTADIDIGGVCNTFEPTPWFSGTYDGRGSSIRNFCFRDTSRSYLGLITYNYGRLSNITLENPVVEGLDVAKFQYMGVGTLAGYNSGPVNNCTVINPSVKAGNLTGGMIGFNYGSISKSNVIGANIDGRVWYIGGMAGVSFGSITDSSSSGKVVGLQIIGGLVGAQWYSSIIRSSSSAKVASILSNGFYDGTGSAGGLAGSLNRAQVTDSYATGPVDGGFCIGGLTGGASYSNISNSHATGTVTGHAIWGDDGGFVGCSYGGSIANSYATGDVLLSVEGNYYGWSRSVGGFAGAAGGTITDSFATGRVVGGACVGGFLGGDNSCGWGWDNPKIRRCFALGDVKGDGAVGGFAGFLGWSLDANITDSYSMGSVTGSGSSNGGLIGMNYGTVSTSYSAAASVTGGADTNGSIGFNAGSISNVYFFNNGIVPPDALATPLSASQITDSASFNAFDFTTPVWRMPSANPGASLLSPVLASQCGKNGVVCQ